MKRIILLRICVSNLYVLNKPIRDVYLKTYFVKIIIQQFEDQENKFGYSLNEICTSTQSMSSNRIERENESCSAVIHSNNDIKRNELHHMVDVRTLPPPVYNLRPGDHDKERTNS